MGEKIVSYLRLVSNSRRRYLLPKQVQFYQKLDFFRQELNEFPRGDEFYGRILQVKEKSDSLSLVVSPIVGKDILQNVQTLKICDSDGFYLTSAPLTVEKLQFDCEGQVQMMLEKPLNVQDQIGVKPGMIITSNSNEYPFLRKIRAFYDSENIIVYQAFGSEIANQALSLGRFGDKLRLRMTWLKTSFFWTVIRSNWAIKEGQTRILAIHLARKAFETLLSVACLTNPVIGLYYENEEGYSSESSRLKNRVQWDPDRTIDGKRKKNKTIQIGIHPENFKIYNEGIREIEDITPQVRRIKEFYEKGEDYQLLIPPQITYPPPMDQLKRLEMHQYFIGENPELIRSLADRFDLES